MDQIAIVILGIGLIFIGNKSGARIYNLASAGIFLYLVFDMTDPFLIVSFIGVAIYQFYVTFFATD